MATKAHCIFCFETLAAHLEGRSALSLPEVESSFAEYTSSTSSSQAQAGPAAEEEFPLFVTWNKDAGNEFHLRGCIGIFSPLPLSQGLSEYAIVAATQDHRFNPISGQELPSLECAVTLLTNFTERSGPLDWELGTHGIRISFTDAGRRYSGTYLPDVAVEQGWTKDEAIASLVRKAGWRGRDWTGLGIKLTTYEGKKVGVRYAEFRAWREWMSKNGR